jgi:glucosamine--fructose-6-phosphate aminotransferase (isomerizing)
MSLHSEILEQPAVIEQLLAQGWPAVQSIARNVRESEIRYVFLAARGTSDNAGLYAKYLLGSQNRIPVAQAAPSLFSIYENPPNLRGALVIAISQSGQSPDIIQVVAEGQRQGVPTLAITNETESPLAQSAAYTIDIHAGDEKAVAATKTYTAELMAIAMLSVALTDNGGQREALDRVPEAMAKALELEPQIIAAAEHFADLRRCVVIGRGYNYATAFEWALKLKELVYAVAEPYSSADFLHGPIAMVEPDFPVLMVAPTGKVFPQLEELARRVRQISAAQMLILSDQTQILNHGNFPLRLPSVPEWVSPLVSILPAQLFCYHLARICGQDTERPRGLKKVTRTT